MAWMTAEAAVAITAGILASSIALTGDAMAAKIRNALTLCRPLGAVENIVIRLRDTGDREMATLYLDSFECVWARHLVWPKT